MRSLLFVPAHKEEYFAKAAASDADALILDLEDSVPAGCKDIARDVLMKHMREGTLRRKNVFVRTNPLQSEDFGRDIDVSASTDILGYLVPKINTKDEVEALDALLLRAEETSGLAPGQKKVIPLIESTMGILNIPDILRGSGRIIAASFGSIDYLSDLEGGSGGSGLALRLPKALLAMASRSAGIPPIDAPYFNLSDSEGFIEEKNESRELGFAGTMIINPRHTEMANRIFSPTSEDISHARAVMNALKEAEKTQTGCVILDGEMIDVAVEKRAKKTIDFADLIEARSKR